MFQLYRVRDIVRIPPEEFGKPLDEAAKRTLREHYEGLLSPEMGLVLAVLDVDIEEMGMIIMGDGATYHRAEFTVLTYQPMRNETVEGQVIEVKDFGVFVRIGPLDGLVHKSQILDDYMEYDESREALRGRETNLLIEKGDKVRAKIVAVSVKPSTNLLRIGLTMKQPYLGKLEWVKREIERQGGE